MGDALPGTVTFLATGVDSSTLLWELRPDAVPAAVARHYELVDAAVRAHGAVRWARTGDGAGVLAEFGSSADAVAAGLAIQLGLGAQEWPTGLPVSVRIGLCTGEVRGAEGRDVHGVRVNSVSPGPVVTGLFGKGAGIDAAEADRTAAVLEPVFAARLESWQPIRRTGVAADVAGALVWLASDAAAFVTGQDLAVDGGITAGRPASVSAADRAAMAEVMTQARQSSR